MFFMGPLFFLLPLLIFWGLPIYLGVRWVKRQTLEARNVPPGLPTREQLDRLLERVESVAEDVERLRERQDFVERLLAAPKPAPGARSAPSAGPDTPSAGPVP